VRDKCKPSVVRRARETSDLPSSTNGSGPGVDRSPTESTVRSVIMPDPSRAGELDLSTDGILFTTMTSKEVTRVTEELLARASETSSREFRTAQRNGNMNLSTQTLL
ncbi:hypothetical protein J6590_098525, partial [Homalodisca vitripennis]